MVKNIFSLNRGWRTELAGPVVVTRRGTARWAVSGPEFLTCLHLSRTELFESRDHGVSWHGPRLLAHGTAEYAVNPSAIICLTSSKLLHLFARYGGYDHEHFEKCSNDGYVQESLDDGQTWGAPRLLPTGERYLSSVLSATQLPTGRVLFPFGYLTPHQGQFVVSVVYSDDEGQTWQRSPSILTAGGAGFESGACEPSVEALPDGRVWMLIRAQTGFQWESFSTDAGRTWSPATPSRLPSSNAPAVLLRLSSGEVVVVWNNAVHWAYARNSLVMAITEDAVHFRGFRELAHADAPHATPEKYWSVTYPYLAEAANGTILVSYNLGDWNWNEARLARVDREWLLVSQLEEDFAEGLGPWCALGATGARLLSPRDDRPGALLALEQPAATTRCGLVRNIPNIARGQLAITATLERPEGCVILHHTFPVPGQTEEAVLRLRWAAEGQLFIGAGVPTTITRNADPKAGPLYSYLGYPVTTEVPYPTPLPVGQPAVVTVAFDATARRADLRVNDGPTVTVPTAEVYGLCYVGLAAIGNGRFLVRRLDVTERPA